MINFDFNEYCCGCGSCANTCHFHAINMQPNEEGFLMPNIDKSKCVDCGLCDKSCPYINAKERDEKSFSLGDFEGKRVYLYYSLNKERKDSASGGFVYDLNRKAIEHGGFVCGCVWNKDMVAVHDIASTVEELQGMQSSKYVQSDMQDCYTRIKDILQKGKECVFCGTPCQTAALKQYLGKHNSDNPNLLTVALMCHGVPSPLVWQRYKESLERKIGGRMISCNMRDKGAKGYSTSYVKYTFGVKRHIWADEPLKNVGLQKPTYLSDPYIFLFTDNLYLRNSCTHCKFKSIHCGADIIVGDFYASTEGAGDMGCSAVIALTDKGDKAIRATNGVIKDSSIQEVGRVNGALFRSVSKNHKRNEFFNRFLSKEEDCTRTLNRLLPFRFHVKKVLNDVGVFSVVKKVISRL